MDELIRLLVEKTGLPEDKARSAAETVVDFLKQRLPGAVGRQLDSCLSGEITPGLAEKVKGVAESVGAVFTKKAS